MSKKAKNKHKKRHIPARGAKWAFSEIYGRLAALQAAGAAPIIEAWLAGELPLTSFP